MYKSIFLLLLITTLFSACGKNNTSNEFFQTNSATQITRNYEHIFSQLKIFKNKLDKRNPKQYNKDLQRAIYKQIDTLQNIVTLRGLNQDILKTHKEYLDIAFIDKNIKYRNDYLTLGLYYMVYDAFSIEKGHKFAALNFDIDKLQKLYKNLQILKWKLKSSKRKNGKYYFVSWQNNWQLELQRSKKKDLNVIYALPSIKLKKESIYSPSNFSFEVILTLMMNDVARTLQSVGSEPSEIAFDTITSLVFLI